MGRAGTVLTLLPRDKLQRYRDQVKRVTKAVQVGCRARMRKAC